MRAFLQVVSLFGIPLALIIWYDFFKNTPAYMFHYFDIELSAWIAIGMHLITALLCLHLPLWLWRRFDASTLHRFCLTGAMASFWVVARLISSERIPRNNSLLMVLIPVVVYFVLSFFLFKLCRPEFDSAEPELASQPDADTGTDTESKNGNA